MLNGPQVGSLLKQATRERIAESVRVDVLNSAQWPKPSNLFLQPGNGFLEAAVQQEQVTGRQLVEGVDDFGRQFDGDDHARLGSTQHDAPGLPVDSVAMQGGGVTEAQAGIEQQQDKRLEPVIGGVEQGGNFLRSEGQRWFRSWYWELHGRCRVGIDPAVTDGEGEERADLNQFLPGCGRTDATTPLERGDRFRADARQGDVASEVQQVIEYDAIAGERPGCQVSGTTIRKVCIDGLGQSDGRGFDGLATHSGNTPDGLVPVARLEAEAAAGGVVVGPDGAGTIDGSAALSGLWASGGMTAVGFGHDWSDVQIDVQRLTVVPVCADKSSVVNSLDGEDER